MTLVNIDATPALRWIGRLESGTVTYWHSGFITIIEFENEDDALLFKLSFEGCF
jgi:hypothetical protein